MHSPADHSQFYMPRENTDGAEPTRKLFPVRRYNRRNASCKSLFASIPSVTQCMQTRVEPHVNDSSKLQRFPKSSVCSRVQLTKGASGRCASDCPRNESRSFSGRLTFTNHITAPHCRRNFVNRELLHSLCFSQCFNHMHTEHNKYPDLAHLERLQKRVNCLNVGAHRISKRKHHI